MRGDSHRTIPIGLSRGRNQHAPLNVRFFHFDIQIYDTYPGEEFACTPSAYEVGGRLLEILDPPLIPQLCVPDNSKILIVLKYQVVLLSQLTWSRRFQGEAREWTTETRTSRQYITMAVPSENFVFDDRILETNQIWIF